MIENTILICAYNQKNTLARALESLRRQIKNPKSYELIIADDCSTDGTVEFVRGLRYPIFLKYVRAESNMGRAANRDRGFRKAMGRWVICVDGDMVPEADFVETYARAWEKYPDAVCVGSFHPPKDRPLAAWEKYLSSRGRLAMASGARVPGKYFTSGNFAIRKDVYEKLSGFDLAFEGWGGEDTDFGLRLEKAGVPLVNVPEAACVHHDQKGLPEILAQYVAFGRNGYPRLLQKYPGEKIFEKGWLLGLPDSGNGLPKRLAAAALWPLRSAPSLALLTALAGRARADWFFDWLFYGHLARGYARRER